MRQLHRPSGLILVTLLALGASGCTAMKTADKALYEGTEAVSERDTVTGERTVALGDRQEQIQRGDKQALKLIEKLKAERVPLDRDANAEQYERMKRIFERVHGVTHLRNESWTPVLIGIEKFNAFVPGGTFMFVFEGMMKQLNDDQLAAVFGHEVAHVSANHVGERLSHQKVAALTDSDSAEDEGYSAAFSHKQEQEADRIGILYAALAGYNPNAAAAIWREQFKKSGNNRQVGRYHTHPVNSERAQAAAVLAEKAQRYYTAGEVNPNFETILSDNVLYEAESNDNQLSAGEGGGLAAFAETAANAAIAHEKAKAEQERQEARARFVRDVQAAMRLVVSRPHGPNTWEIGLRYYGRVPLRWVTVAGVLPDNAGEALTFTRKVAGPIQPGMVMSVLFEDPNLPANRLNPKHVRVHIDDAEPR